MEDIICNDHHMLQVINSFGFTLGFGDQTVQEACFSQKIDQTTFLSVINFIHHPQNEKKPENSFPQNISPCTLKNYVQRSHDYFLHYRLPATRRRLIEAIDCSGEDKVPYLFLKFFDLFTAEVEQHALYENTYIHPYVNHLIQGVHPTQDYNISLLMKKQKEHHHLIRKKISDLTHVIVKYYKNQKKNRLMNDVLYELFVMEEDFRCHSMIEEQIFTASIQALEEKANQPRSLKNISNTSHSKKSQDTLNLLSKREKEIICLVTKGLPNRQIAELLNISINTVLTHRRHINKKLEIHSSSELTIHAILNGLVSINDIK